MTAKPKPTADQLFRAARYAGAIFVRMAQADSELTDAEVDEVQPKKDSESSLAFNVAFLALFVSGESELVLELVRRISGVECSLEDLDGLSQLLEALDPSLLRSRTGLQSLRKVIAEWQGLSTVAQQRSAVVDDVAMALEAELGPDAVIKGLKELHPRFGGLKRELVSETLERTTRDEKSGGKMPGGKARLSPLGAAATLAVAVGAWDDSDYKKSKAAFADAAKSEAERRKERQRVAAAEIERLEKYKL